MRACHSISRTLYKNIKYLLEYNTPREVAAFSGLSLDSIRRIRLSTSYKDFDSKRKWKNFRVRQNRIKITVIKTQQKPQTWTEWVLNLFS